MLLSANFTNGCSGDICAPFTVRLFPGKYLLEVWGAQGGNISESIQGGNGGYSSGILFLHKQKVLHVFLGESGKVGTSVGFTANTYNGGGKGYTHTDRKTASGGGGSDIRLSSDFRDRIIVAGGGGGAAKYFDFYNSGGCGGGYIGGNGTDGLNGNTPTLHGEGGNQERGGIGYGARSGKICEGGNQTNIDNYGSGGGGGYYGGGAGHWYGATGGGGSGFISGKLQEPNVMSGCLPLPNFYTGLLTEGHKGDGAARITQIGTVLTCKHSINSYKFNILLFASLSLKF